MSQIHVCNISHNPSFQISLCRTATGSTLLDLRKSVLLLNVFFIRSDQHVLSWYARCFEANLHVLIFTAATQHHCLNIVFLFFFLNTINIRSRLCVYFAINMYWTIFSYIAGQWCCSLVCGKNKPLFTRPLSKRVSSGWFGFHFVSL